MTIIERISYCLALDPTQRMRNHQQTKGQSPVHPSQPVSVTKAHAGLRGVRRRQEHFGFAQAVPGEPLGLDDQQVMVRKHLLWSYGGV
jgi:hypothetical protein